MIATNGIINSSTLSEEWYRANQVEIRVVFPELDEKFEAAMSAIRQKTRQITR